MAKEAGNAGNDPAVGADGAGRRAPEGFPAGSGGGGTELDALRRRFARHTPGLLGAVHEYAVLCPVVEREGGAALLFEVRSPSIRQGGEVCFPGGRIEPGETDVECALRETEEELSIPRGQVEIIGRSDFICNQRGFLLRPVIGALPESALHLLRPSPAEVAEAFTVPLAFFRERAPEIYTYTLHPSPPEGFPYQAVGISEAYPWAAGQVEVPVWYWQGRAIWGMTARITAAVAGYCAEQ